MCTLLAPGPASSRANVEGSESVRVYAATELLVRRTRLVRDLHLRIAWCSVGRASKPDEVDDLSVAVERVNHPAGPADLFE